MRLDTGLMTRAEWDAFSHGLSVQSGPRDLPGLIRKLVATNRLTAYQAAELADGWTDRLRFDEYLILDRIGAGGMGVVGRRDARGPPTVP